MDNLSAHSYKVDISIMILIFYDLRVTLENIYSRGNLILKTTFSYFPGMLENPAPAVKSSLKNFKKI